jgi:hypothetical protein
MDKDDKDIDNVPVSSITVDIRRDMTREGKGQDMTREGQEQMFLW